MIHLFYLADPRYGGWPTYTCHLYHGLCEAGKQPILHKVGNNTEAKMRSYGRGIQYQNVTIEDAIFMAKTEPTFITAVGKKHYANAARMIQAGASVCVHDPTELKEPFASSLTQHKANVVVIREKMLEHVPQAKFIPHPYKRCNLKNTGTKETACAISRVDHDKNTLLIAQANQQLKQPVKIYGALNRIYTHFKLDEEVPGWDKNYEGSPKANSLWACAKVASKYQYTVDMSVIKGDGGGTQYTFLEALDVGARLIVHKEWMPTGDLKQATIQVANSKELIEAIQSGAVAKTNGTKLLKKHDCKEVAETLFEYVTRKRE